MPQSASTLATDGPSCELTQKIHQLTNPTGQSPQNEQAFYQLLREEGVASGTSALTKVQATIDSWSKKIASMACSRAQKAGCQLALIPRRIQTGLTKLKFAKYALTLKVREAEGKALVFVKGSGLKPYRDPGQPDGVKERYENSYHWLFREKAGDLHPAFIWSKLEGQEPYYLESICLESPKYCRNPFYRKVLTLWRALLEHGYLTAVDRGDEQAMSIKDLYLVNHAKTEVFSKDPVLKELIAKLFGAGRVQAYQEVVHDLLKSRADPVLVPNAQGKYELTEDLLKKMGLEMPMVSLDSWSVYFVDHHRITAAHDLGMAIQVLAYDSFVSIN